MSQVVVVRYPAAGPDNGLGRQQYSRLLQAGLTALAGKKDIRDAVHTYLPSGVIGLKTNCLVRAQNSTPTALSYALTDLLTEAGFDENNLVIWERTSRELQRAGYTLNAASFGLRCFGTDANGLGYGTTFFTSGQVNSLVSRVLTDIVTYNINLPVLKDHSIAGMSGALKNMYGAIHNPNKYHDNNCDPYCAHVNNLEPIRDKTKLVVVDAGKVQYNGGPGYVDRFIAYYNGIIISDDPVAADRIGLQILEHLRKVNGQKTLTEVGRSVKYLDSAEKLGLGVADFTKIDLTVLQTDDTGQVAPGELL